MSKKLFAGLALGLAVASGAHAQAWPSKPVTLLVPFPPGGSTDLIARTLGAKLSESLGQPVVVENRGGAATIIGADAVAKAAPDGYTWLLATSTTLAINPHTYKSLPYDALKDFTPIAEVATGSMALVVNPRKLPVASLAELIAAARARGGQLNYASPGNGTPQHLAMEVLKQRVGFNALHIPYKGSAGAISDLLGGQVQLAVLPVHTVIPLAKAGKLNVIAVSGERRSVLAPDLPSFADLGVPNLGLDLYFWLAGPAGLPQDIAQKWTQELAAILQLPDVRDTFIRQGMVPNAVPPDQQAKEIAADVARWKKFIAETGIKTD